MLKKGFKHSISFRNKNKNKINSGKGFFKFTYLMKDENVRPRRIFSFR